MSDKHLEENELTVPIAIGMILKIYFSVYNRLGYGFSREIYKNGMRSSLRQTILKVEQDKTVTVYFETDALGQIIIDFVVNEKILVQITADDELQLKSIHRMKNYLKASDYNIGLLLNFGEKPAYKSR